LYREGNIRRPPIFDSIAFPVKDLIEPRKERKLVQKFSGFGLGICQQDFSPLCKLRKVMQMEDRETSVSHHDPRVRSRYVGARPNKLLISVYDS